MRKPDFGSVKEACVPWEDWSQSGVQDWDGGNTECPVPTLSKKEIIVVAGCMAVCICFLIPIVIYDWCHGGGRRA